MTGPSSTRNATGGPSDPVCERAWEAGAARLAPEYAEGSRIFSLVLLVILLLYYVMTCVWWLLSLRKPLIRKRSTLFLLISAAGGMLLSASMLYRIYIGPGNYPCDIHVWRFLGLPLIAGPIVTRTALFYTRSRFNQLMVELDEPQATVLEQYRNLSSINVFHVFWDWLGAHCTMRRARITGDGDRSSIGRREDQLLLLFFFTTNPYGVFIWLLTLIIAFMYIAYLYAATDSPLGRGCLGCGSSSFETIYLGTVLLGLSGLGGYLLWRIRYEEDPLGIITELRLSLLCFVPFVLLSVLTAVDPGDLAYKGIFSWGVLMPINVAAVHHIQCPMQLFRRDARRRSRSLSKTEPDWGDDAGSSAAMSSLRLRAPRSLEEVLAIPSGRHTFLRFLAKEWSVENLYFHDAVLRYRAMSSGGALAREHAMRIFRTFIVDGAIFQVNISAVAFNAIAQRIEETGNATCEDAPADLFDEADDEIFHLMRTDSFARFVRSTIFSGWVAESSQAILVPVTEAPSTVVSA